MKIFQRSLTREFTAIGSSVVLVLIAIIVTRLLIMYLGQAATGAVEAEAVTALLGFALIGNLPVILALAIFIAVLLTLSRSYRESEMPIWFSSGLSLLAWVSPVLKFGTPVIVVTAALSFFLTPWALREKQQYDRMLQARDEVSRIAPGIFVESRSSNRVVFVDNTSSATGVVNNVFVQYNQNGRFGVVVAEHGNTEYAANGDKFLVLSKGRRYEGTPGALDFKIIDFESQKLRIEASETASGELSARQMPTLDLIKSPTAERLAELHWRAALPLAALVLSLVAIPLAFVNPRSGTSLNLVMGVVVFFLYYGLLQLFEALTKSGRIPTWIGLTPVHLGMIILLAFLFSRQLFGFRWLAFAKR